MKALSLPVSIYLKDKTWLDFDSHNDIYLFWERHGHSLQFAITPKSLLELFKKSDKIIPMTQYVIDRINSESESCSEEFKKKRKQ
jgi:hypothetical protein